MVVLALENVNIGTNGAQMFAMHFSHFSLQARCSQISTRSDLDTHVLVGIVATREFIPYLRLPQNCITTLFCLTSVDEKFIWVGN